MPQHDDFSYELRRLTSLGAPVVITQFGTMLIGVVDTIMLGAHSVEGLDAAALGHVWIFGSTIFALGVIFGLDPIISQAHGANHHRRIAVALQRGLILALLLSLPITALWAFTEELLTLAGQQHDLAALAHRYVWMQAPSIAPYLLFLTLRQYLQGRNIVAPALWVTLTANVFNVVANWVLIFGALGFPALGVDGAAIASCSTRFFLFIGLVAWIWLGKLHVEAWRPWSRRAIDPRGLGDVFIKGVPVGLQYLFEGWAFQISTLMAGWLGKHALAAHSIVLNVASLSFMMPWGLSIGAATRVGNLIGAKRPEHAARSAWISIGLGGAVMLCAALIFIVLRYPIPSLYSSDSEVITLAASIFPIAAAFQLFDGIQAVGGGVLRGYGDTRPAAFFNLIGYYLLALPLSYLLAFVFGWGLAGIWWALCFGLAIVAGMLLLWTRRLTRSR